jgi:predicted TIM-barrel fold metal-dependent hydrolase
MTSPLIIDTHMHLYPSKEEGRKNVTDYDGWEFEAGGRLPSYGKFGGDPADGIAALDEAGADRAIFVQFETALVDRRERIAALPTGLNEDQREAEIAKIYGEIAASLRASNLWACQVGKDNPRLIIYVCIDPHVMTSEENVAHLRDMVENHGAKGIKLHSVIQGFFMGDPRMWPVWEACIEMGLGVVAHSGSSPVMDQYGDPFAFASVYERYPDLKLVMAHMGNGSWHQTRRFAEAYPKALYDVCELMEWIEIGKGPSPAQFAQLIRDVGADRVMLGTDFPWWDPIDCVERVMGLPLLAREEKEAILGENAVRLLGI